MKPNLTMQTLKRLAFAAVALGIFAQGIAETNALVIQRRPATRGGGGFWTQAPPAQRSGGFRMQSPPVRKGGGYRMQTQPVHARRDVVRTQNFVSRSPSGEFRSARPARQTTATGGFKRTAAGGRTSNATGAVVQRSFTGTSQGRLYDNGLPLRQGRHTKGTWRSHYFPSGYSYFPYYYNGYSVGNSLVSPYGYYYGLTVPYVNASVGQWYPPAVNFVDVPTYTGNVYSGFSQAKHANLIDDAETYAKEPGLDAALNELTETFNGRNIDGLATLVDPNVSVAVYTSAHYQYSIAANNLVDLTRDALQTNKGIGFKLQTLHQRSSSVFTTSGENDYKDANGVVHAVYMSFVLQDFSGQWTLTQIGTSPDALKRA